MIRLFLENRIGVLLILPFIIGFYLFLNMQFPYYKVVGEANLGFWSDALNGPIWVYQILSGFIILLNAVILNWTFNSHEFLDKNSYIVSLLYVVTMSFYHSFYSLDGSLIAHSFLILMLSQLFLLRQNSDGKRNVFNGFFFAGVASTFHPMLLFAFPFIVGMMLIIRPFIFRELILALVGFIIPNIYALVFLWFSQSKISLKILESASNFQLKTDFMITLILFGILLALGTFSLRKRMVKSSIRLKKQIQIIWLTVFIACSLGIFDFIYFHQIERFSLLMIPLSFLLTYSFLNKSYGILASVIFYLAIIYSIVKFFIVLPSPNL